MYTSIFLNPVECLDKSLVEFCRESLIHIKSKWSISMLKLELLQIVGDTTAAARWGGGGAGITSCGARHERLLDSEVTWGRSQLRISRLAR